MADGAPPPAPVTPETPPTGGPATTPTTPPGGGFDWKSQIPDELKAEKVWADVPDFPTLAKRFVDGHKYNVGALRLPPKYGTSVSRCIVPPTHLLRLRGSS